MGGSPMSMTLIGHFGTGDLEFSVKTEADLEAAKRLCELAYQRVGG